MLDTVECLEAPTKVRCAQCGSVPHGDAFGWKAYLSGGFEGEPIEVGVFCPVCAMREDIEVE